MRLRARAAPERRVGWRPRARRTRHRSGSGYTEPYGSVCNTRIGGMQAEAGIGKRVKVGVTLTFGAERIGRDCINQDAEERALANSRRPGCCAVRPEQPADR